ncbi:hypothetical protein VKT23_011449 [Stygiomarasmius scandens]|uniref:Uncharacterized protein n=1 Tax=Marasmiellus scandens TaxID=2682957 RepID=A0ABR1J978_9AGAR
MDPPSVSPFTNEQLEEAGLLGEGESLSDFTLYPTLTVSLCINNWGQHKPLYSPLSDASTVSTHTMASNTTAVAPYDISGYERTTYYHGISPDPPELLYRSDFCSNPFPKPVGRHPHLPTKTIYGVFNTPLNDVWDTVAPQIRDLLKARKICYSAIQTARFLTHGEDDNDYLGPIVIWIATYPTTTTAENAHDASQDILALLEANEVKGAVVEWYEGAVEKLSGPALLRVTDDTDPTHYIRRFLTAGLGMPIVTAGREDDDAQGSVALFFHENKDRQGNASTRVFGVSNCHVLREKTNVNYEFKGAGAPRQLVRVAGFHRFQRGISEIRACISSHGIIADLLTREIVGLEAKPKSEDPDEAAEDKAAVEAKRIKLAKVKEDIGIFENFYSELNSKWGDIECRNIGHVNWAPEISVDVEGRHYTKDIGTFEVEAARFRPQFKGNVVDLGVKFTPQQFMDMFSLQSDGSTVLKLPTNYQLRIKGWLTRELLAKPNCFDSNGEPCLTVMKDGNTTDLTVGRYAGLEAYICDEFGVESVELAFYNYNMQSGLFSAKGDSGSLIFDGMGRMVAILHSGMRKSESNHVTYATPAWWAIEQLKLRYPYADFNREAF